MADLSSRGHHSMTVQEDGHIQLTDGSTSVLPELHGFPPVGCWGKVETGLCRRWAGRRGNFRQAGSLVVKGGFAYEIRCILTADADRSETADRVQGDYLTCPQSLRMESYGKEMFLHLSDDSGTELIEPMTITGIAHRQIGTHLRIPAAYYDRMREERPDLLAYNANTWFKQENSQRMLRTLDGSARAYLSNRYRRIDNIDIAGVTLPILGGLPDIRFESCQITESRIVHQGREPRLQAEVSPGGHCAGRGHHQQQRGRTWVPSASSR